MARTKKPKKKTTTRKKTVKAKTRKKTIKAKSRKKTVKKKPVRKSVKHRKKKKPKTFLDRIKHWLEKRAQGLPMTTIVIIIIVLIVLAVVVIFFFGQFGIGEDTVGQQLTLGQTATDEASQAWTDFLP